MTVFAGEFETHLTVRAADLARVDALGVWAAARHTVLDRGVTPSHHAAA